MLILNSPRQLVEVPDENGIVRRAQFEANVRAYEDGRARGGAVLHLGKERYEFRFERLAEMLTDGQVVRSVTFELAIESSASKPKLIDKGFGFIRDEGGIEHFPKLVYDFQFPDIQDEVAYDKPPFEADGTLRLMR